MRLSKPIKMNNDEATILHVLRYQTNDNIALILDNSDNPNSEDSLIITVNIDSLPDSQVTLDSNKQIFYDVDELARSLQENGVLGDKVGYQESGYCTYPVFFLKLNAKTIKKEMMG